MFLLSVVMNRVLFGADGGGNKYIVERERGGGV